MEMLLSVYKPGEAVQVFDDQGRIVQGGLYFTIVSVVWTQTRITYHLEGLRGVYDAGHLRGPGQQTSHPRHFPTTFSGEWPHAVERRIEELESRLDGKA